MATGIEITARQHANIIFEDTAGTYNPNGAAVLASDFKGDFQEKIERGKHRNEGQNALAYVHNKKRWVELSGDFDPEFRHFEKWMRMGFQILSDEVISSGANTGGRRIVAILPNEGAIDRKTTSIEWGRKTKATRSTLGLLTSLSIKNDVNGDCSGSLNIKARKPLARNVAMTGSVAQSAVLRFGATGVSSDGVFAVKVGDAASQNVTLSIGDATGDTVTKLAAVGVTATVAGTVATAPGEVHRIYGPSVTGNAVFYNGAITLNPYTSTPTSLTTSIQALGGSFASRTAAGTITAPSFGTNLLSGKTLTGYTGAQNTTLTDGSLTSTAQTFGSGEAFYSYTPPANITVSRVRLYITAVSSVDGVAGISNSFGGPSFTLQGGGTTVTFPIGTTGWVNFVLATPTVFGPTAPLVIQALSQSAVELREIEAYASATTIPGFVDITITAPSGAGNVPDIEVNPGTGYTGTSTPPGGSSGAIVATVTAPANTPITVTKVSGANWTYTAQQTGSDGKLTRLKRSPIGPRMWRAWRTSTLPAVDSDPDIIYKLGTLLDHEITFNDIVKEVDFEDDDDSFQSFADGVDATEGLKVTANCTLATADTGAVTSMVQEANDPLDEYGDADNVTGANWYRFRAKRGRFRLAFDLHACVMDSTEYKDASGVYAIGFPLGVVNDDVVGFFARIVLELSPA